MEHPLVCQVVSKGKSPIDSWICNGGQTQGTIPNSHKKKGGESFEIGQGAHKFECKVKSIYTNWKKWQLVQKWCTYEVLDTHAHTIWTCEESSLSFL